MFFPIEWVLYLQIGILLLFIGMMLLGYKEGFLLKLFDLISGILAIFLSLYLAKLVARSIVILPKDLFAFGYNKVLEETLFFYTNQLLVGFVIWIILCIVFTLVKAFFKTVNEIPLLGGINRLLGSVLGGIHAYLIIVVVAYLFSTPLCINGNEVLQESKLIYVYKSAESLFDALQNQYEMYTSLKKEEAYKEDPYGNIRIFFDMYDIDVNTQNKWIEMLKMRSE